MKLRYILVILGITLANTTSIATANPFSLVIGNDKTRVNIFIPEGYCSLVKSDPSDTRVLTLFDKQAKGKHRRLAFMVNCDQLESWRNGDLLTFDDFGYVLLDVKYIDKVSDEPLDEFLNDMVNEIGHGRKNIIRHRGDGYLKRYVEQHVTKLEQSASVDLGLIHRDNYALYTASLNKITTEIGEQKLSAEVSAITKINGKPLFFYLIRKLGNLKTIVEIESDLSKWVISAHQAN